MATCPWWQLIWVDSPNQFSVDLSGLVMHGDLYKKKLLKITNKKKLAQADNAAVV